MLMWSRGLGKENLQLEFDKGTVRTLDEALEGMPPPAKECFVKKLNGDSSHCITITGKISPPVGWEYVIYFSRKDVFMLLRKLITLKTIKLFV